VLNQWLLGLFNVKRFEELAEHLRNETLEGLDERRIMRGEESIVWKYFQYLTLLFTEIYLDHSRPTYAAPGGHLQADERPLQRNRGALEVDIGPACGPFVQALFRPAFGALGPLDIDLFRHLGRLGQNADFVGRDLGVTPGDGQVAPLGPDPVGELPHAQRGEERGVTREHAELPQGSRRRHLVHVLADHQAFRGDHF
jgi:hypothetical protein